MPVPRARLGGKASNKTKKSAKYYAAEAAVRGLIEDTGKSWAAVGWKRRQSYRSAGKQRKADQAKEIRRPPFKLPLDSLPEDYITFDFSESRKALVIWLKGSGKRWCDLVVTKYTSDGNPLMPYRVQSRG